MRTLLLVVFFFFNSEIAAAFPAQEISNKEITVTVYTKAGGLIDTTARQLAKSIEATQDQAVIIKNHPGGAGLKALYHFLEQPADGYNILAITNSFISQVIAAGKKDLLNDLHFLALLARDYECLIVNRESQIQDLASLKKLSQNKELIWAGPAAGGTDYLFAQKVFKTLGIKGKWLPYASGKRGMLAVAGGHADVYVGNPADTIGFDNLKILAHASPKRLVEYPDVPTFAELNFPELSAEVLWRGLAVGRNTGQETISELEALLSKATQSKSWQEYLASRSVESAFVVAEPFEQMINVQLREHKAGKSLNKNWEAYWHYYILAALAFSILFFAYSRAEIVAVSFSRKLILLTAGYLIAMPILGYYIATAFFVFLYGLLKGFSVPRILITVCIWLLFIAVVFQQILNIPVL